MRPRLLALAVVMFLGLAVILVLFAPDEDTDTVTELKPMPNLPGSALYLDPGTIRQIQYAGVGAGLLQCTDVTGEPSPETQRVMGEIARSHGSQSFQDLVALGQIGCPGVAVAD